ncbi:transmembrane protein 198-like [Thalassophryne amazonica]|uniref:transmembrane protein 198-like n=1 Tax=Thalassophryne amazonica TaxID=390379 RepID=UPI0014719071|nr:transmembrane protein 198-like [Thalassophryne amazonica]
MAVTSLYVTEEPRAAAAEVDICTLEITKKYEVIPSTVCSVCLTLGLVYCLFGYHCLKMVMFFSGFVPGSAALFLLYHKEPVLDAQLGPEAMAGIGLGVGVLCGLMTMLVSTMGLLLSGLQLGCLLSLHFLVVLGQFYSLTPVWLPLSAVLAASILTAVFTLQWQKLFTIISTSVFGAATVMLCMDYLLGTFMLPDQVYEMFRQVAPRPMCWFNWVITAISPVMTLMGVLVQWKFTANGASSHTEVANKKQKKHVKQHRYKEERSRRQPYQRRRPPLLKRYAGDVLAPSYLQSLREHQTGTGSSTSSISTITHTGTDLDFETGSMVPLTPASPAFRV